MNDSNIQDSGTVIGLLEVGFQAIIKEVPFITEVVLVLANVSSYKNHLLTFMIEVYSQKFEQKLFISSMVHSEAQYKNTLHTRIHIFTLSVILVPHPTPSNDTISSSP